MDALSLRLVFAACIAAIVVFHFADVIGTLAGKF